jgi:ribosomal protein S18 acetylase RimI-like enzyme
MEIRVISWEQTIPLRQSVLWPSKPETFCYVDGDVDGVHYGAFIGEALVCVASIYLTSNKARLRKFATDAKYQHQGIGSRMLVHIIQSLKNSPVDIFWCDARESAVEFYRRFGMNKCNERFYKAGEPYYKMKIYF